MAVARLASLCAVPSLASTSEGIEAGNRGSKCCSFRNSGFFGATLEMVANEQRSHKATRSARASSEQEEMFQLPATHKIKAASLAALEQLRNAGANRYTSEKASILVIGLSVHTAPVEMREKLAIPEAEWPRAIEELCKNNHIEEAAVLSTCNRMEIYVVALSWHRGVKEVEEWMSKISGISNNELREHLFILRERDATEHLFRVASGLDSLVLGEGQILAQVKQVYLVGQDAKGFGRNLGGLFKHAITAGKRVRSETSIAAGAVSVSSAAVELAHLKLSDKGFSSARVVIVGAGKMSKLLVKHLISKGCNSMVIVNRTEKRVSDLREEFDEAELIYQPLEQMFKCAGEADIIFTSTASDHPLFLKEHVDCLPPASESVGYTRHFIDISVPRNVSSCVAELPSTRVYNVDDLKDVVAANKEERKKKAMEAQVIIRQEMGSFEDWRDSLQTVPTIKKLREYAERIRASELEKSLSKMSSDMSKKDRKQIEDLTRAIVNKLLHGPMQHLRSDGNNSRTVAETLENMHALERMFDLKSEISAIEQRLKIESQSRSQ